MNEPLKWMPYPGMQTRFLQSTAFETLAGGARGPGKTDVGVVNLAKPQYLNEPRARALVIRKNADDLGDWLDRARFYYRRYGGVITGLPGIVTFPCGYKIKCGHLKDENAYTKYQGQEFPIMLIEELTQIPREEDYLKLIASCRSSVPGLAPRVYATTNPGGSGHGWVKKRFVDPSPPNIKFIAKDTGRTRIFLPGLVDENTQLIKNDPDYVKTLDSLKQVNPELWKAWRYGNWETFAGQYFQEFNRDRHVINPFIPTKDSFIVGGMDWGRANPFAFYLSIVEKVYYRTDNGDSLNFNRTKTFLEVYGTEKTPSEWSKVIKRELERFRLSIDDITWVQCDPTIFNKGNDNSISIRDQFFHEDEGWRTLKPGSNARIPGWQIMRSWLSIAPDGLPYWQMTSNCVNLIRTLPELIHDDNNVEDIESNRKEGHDDDSADSTRYMLKAIRWVEGISGVIKGKYQEIPEGNKGKFWGGNENMKHHVIKLSKFK